MGEQPLFSCKAHVFQLEPELKKSWISLSSSAVNVQIFHDPIKNIYRIVSIEGTKALINSIVTAKMTFTKTSQKFGQWIDFKLNLVYGLGFPNDTELNKFVEKFKEIKEFTRNTFKSHERSNSCEISSAQNRQNIQINDTLIPKEKALKNENERLKQTLSECLANSKKTEEEIQMLRSNNSHLNKALAETNINADCLKQQMQLYKDENIRLKNLNQSSSSNNIIENTCNIKLDELHDSSSNSTNSFNTNQLEGNSKQKRLKQDLKKLSETFNEKLKELYDIKENMDKIINEIN